MVMFLSTWQAFFSKTCPAIINTTLLLGIPLCSQDTLITMPVELSVKNINISVMNGHFREHR